MSKYLIKLRHIPRNIISLAVAALIFSCSDDPNVSDRWKAPPSAEKIKNPFVDKINAEQGRQLYDLYCRSCHGELGRGDGAAGKDLAARPANLLDDNVQKQSHGALFWKLSKGNESMPGFEKILSEQQRWQLVSYIRLLPKKAEVRLPPKALRDDIIVEHLMAIGPKAVRILQHPLTGDLWYTNFDGDVFRINMKDSPVTAKILTAQDHGNAVLQGALFKEGTLYLCGNVYSENKQSTHGRMVRCEFQDTVKHRISVVFTTADYGANKTIYDHGWNAMVLSPDGKYIYVNSGARTDHGEIQDNGGLYPNARDNALTARIFRIPAEANDLFLADDDAKLKADGYLYADGIRNAYDLAFDGEGNLFGVSNSADYDYPEDMFWIRQGHHYGFPWVMGGLENPQQYKDWHPDLEKDPFINKVSHSWKVKYYYNDPGFPERPKNVKFSAGVQNLGPDANEYRGHSGKIQDGDQTGVAVSTFTAHCSPLGLFFDTRKGLSEEFNGDGFALRFSLGSRSALMAPFTTEGADLLHLQLTYNETIDNFYVRTKRIVEGFRDPVDAILIDDTVYVIEYDGQQGNIWRITLPKRVSSVKSMGKKLQKKLTRQKKP